jgi:hypothetical protein
VLPGMLLVCCLIVKVFASLPEFNQMGWSTLGACSLQARPGLHRHGSRFVSSNLENPDEQHCMWFTSYNSADFSIFL